MSKILIIEDEDAIRRVLKKVLLDENPKFVIDEAGDGVEAIDKVKNSLYDLIICDIKMPKKDGIEVLNFIKKIQSAFKCNNDFRSRRFKNCCSSNENWRF